MRQRENTMQCEVVSKDFSLLDSLLYDLEGRCNLVKQRLLPLDDPETRLYVLSAYEAVEMTRREVKDLRADPTLHIAEFRQNHFAQYRLRKQRLSLIESYTLPFVERFSAPDRQLTRTCRLFLNQVAWPIDAPLVTAFSSQYYWVPSAAEVVAVPAVDTMTLLGFPDLCHELGHLLWRHHQVLLSGEFFNEVLDYIREQQRLVKVEQRPPALNQDFTQLSAQWKDGWIAEFAADMIATYLTGPTFGWQNARLCAETQRSAYEPGLGQGSLHPADAARHIGVLSVLQQLGDTSSARQVDIVWEQYLEWSGEAEAGQYAICYPCALIESLAQKVVKGCRALGIRSYCEAPVWDEGCFDIAALITASWNRFLSTPDEHGQWESRQIEVMKSRLESTYK